MSETNIRPTPETDGAAGYMAVDDSGFHRHPAGGLVPVEIARTLERERDEARELCDFNAKQLLVAVNDRNSLGVQLDLLRDELKRIAARIGESGLGDDPYLSHISDYCQRAQKDIAVRYTPIEERDRACERLSVVSSQLDDCKAQRDRLLAALKALLQNAENKAVYISMLEHTERFDSEGNSVAEYSFEMDKARAAIAEVDGELTLTRNK